MTYPVLYLFPNTGLSSMSPGKAMAHTAHAANAFVHTMKRMSLIDQNSNNADIPGGGYNPTTPIQEIFNKWETSTPQGFGTTIVLQTHWSKVLDVIDVIGKSPYVNVGISTDPTYPYMVDDELADLIPETTDTAPRHPGAPGKTVLYRSEDTCAWVFGMKDNIHIQTVLGQFSLHP